jgi:hypothetical protein
MFCERDRRLEVGPESYIGVTTSDQLYFKQLLGARTVSDMNTNLVLFDGSYEWRNFYLTNKAPRVFPPPLSGSLNNASFDIILTAAGPLRVEAVMVDHDNCMIGPNPPFCNVSHTFLSRSLTDWAGPPQTITMNGSTSEGTCTITATVEEFELGR